MIYCMATGQDVCGRLCQQCHPTNVSNPMHMHKNETYVKPEDACGRLYQ